MTAAAPVRALASVPKVIADRSDARSSTRANMVESSIVPAGNLAVQRWLTNNNVQAKLSVSTPSDPDEVEADRVADNVTSGGSAGKIQGQCTACASGQPCSSCDEKPVQRKSAHSNETGTGPDLGHVISAIRGGGRPLAPALRREFEPSIGHDLSSVQVHTHEGAASAAQSIGALAYTHGNNIAFGPGQYRPQERDGKRLLAHELTHVVQQRNGDGGKINRDVPVDPDGKIRVDPNKPTPQSTQDKIDKMETDEKKKQALTEPKRPPDAPDAKTQDDALTEIKKINSDTWIAFWQEYRLESLWDSFGTALPQVAWDNKGDWDRSYSGGADLYDIVSTTFVANQFRTATAGIARGYLRENIALATREKNAIGPDPKAAPTQEQLDEVNARRDAAQRIMDAEQAMAALRSTSVGYDRGVFLRSSDCYPIVNREGFRTLEPTHFNPQRPPEIDTQGDEKCGRRPTFGQTMGMWTRLTEGIEGETAKYPALFAITRNLDEKKIATKENNTAESSRAKMLEALDDLIDNINSTDGKLDGELNLELFPIHQQLFALAPWSGEFPGLVAHHLVDKHASDQFWISMGLGALAAALFVVATLATGGLAAVLFGAAAGVSGGIAINSWEEFSDLNKASKTNLTQRTEIVTSGQASAALFTAVLDTVFAFLDIYSAARGVAGLTKVARGSAAGAGATAKTLEGAVEEETRAVAKSAAEIGSHDGPKVAEALRNGGGQAVTDEALKKQGYVLEVAIKEGEETHWYRQLEDGSWCRFSKLICGIPGSPELSRLAEGARRGFEHPAETVALKGLVESTEHEAPKLISAARIAETTGKLVGRFPVLNTLKKNPGAIERIVRAGYAAAEGGGLRRAIRGVSAAKGQLLEEISAARIRTLLDTPEGLGKLGLGHLTDKPILIEGHRITDAAGAKLTDGIIAIQRGDRLEIVAVIESKAGAFAAEGLEESLIGLKRANTSEIIQAIFEMSGKKNVTNSGLMARIKAIDPVLHKQISETMGANLASQAEKLKDMREPLINAINKLSDAEIKALKTQVRTGEGQISRDIERLMKEGKLNTLKIDGKTVEVTVPQRPSFVGVTPPDVPIAPIEAGLKTGGYELKGLDLGPQAMQAKDLGELASEIVNALGPDLERAAAPAVPTPTP